MSCWVSVLAPRKVESIGDPDKSGTDDALQIDPVVFVETLVLDRYKSVGHKFIVRGDLVVCLVHTVGIRVLERFNDCAVCIYNVRCISFGRISSADTAGALSMIFLAKTPAPTTQITPRRSIQITRALKKRTPTRFFFILF